MARALTPQDAHSLMNLLVKEATGQNASIQTVNAANFVSAGETVLATGVENTLNSLAIVLGRRFAAVRPYKGKFRNIQALNTGMYTSRFSKISYYSRESLAAGDWNTNLYPENLLTGVDNTGSTSSGHERTPSMWEQNHAVPLEMYFGGQSVWEDSTSVLKNQLKVAFRDEASFNTFVSGIMVEKGNDIESQKEAFNHLTLLNYMAGLYDIDAVLNNGMAVNLTTQFNSENSTSYTTAQLQTTYKKEFLMWFVGYIDKLSQMLEIRSALHHWSPTKTVNGTSYTLLRHSPRDKQKLFLYEPFIIDAKTQIMPEIFHDGALNINNYEGVMYWQTINDPSAIKVTPAIPDVAGTNSGMQTTGSTVDLGYVLGVLFDEDACMTDFQLDDADATPLEARKKYYNLWWSFSRNAISDFTENGVLLYMKDVV